MKQMKVRIDFPLESIAKPVFSELVKEFDVSPNVLSADIDAQKGGWMVLGLNGDEAQLAAALDFVRNQGAAVSEMT